MVTNHTVSGYQFNNANSVPCRKSTFAEGESGSATGAVQWHQADSSTAPAARPTAQIQLAYVQAPFHASEDNGQG